MDAIKKLPDAEFEIMKVIWNGEPHITTNHILAGLNNNKHWKPQTVLTLLVRLIERGFVQSVKVGKERTYTPLISEQDYLQFETGNFIKRYYENSLTGLVNTLYAGKNLTEKDIAALKTWLDERM